MSTRILPPSFQVDSVNRYRLAPREKTAFKTVMKAQDLLDLTGNREATITVKAGDTFEYHSVFPILQGTIHESFTLEKLDGRLASHTLTRTVYDLEEKQKRHEKVDFSGASLPLPNATYPEVILPFLLSWQPLDGKIRSAYAWINDRFIARVEYQSLKSVSLQLPNRRVKAIKAIMYPDFNDWVPLGKMLTKLARPFIPKYHMWFSPEPPHTVLRFEGSYGPPGAPEIVLELL